MDELQKMKENLGQNSNLNGENLKNDGEEDVKSKTNENELDED